MVRDDSNRPVLFPVVQVTEFASAKTTGQFTPLMVIVYSSLVSENPSPEKVTLVPPYTGPNLGLIEFTRGVKSAL